MAFFLTQILFLIIISMKTKILLILFLSFLTSCEQPTTDPANPMSAKMHKFATFIREEGKQYMGHDHAITKQNYSIYLHSVLIKYSDLFLTPWNYPQFPSCVRAFVDAKHVESFSDEEVFEDIATNFYNFLSQQPDRYPSVLKHFYPQQIDKGKWKKQKSALSKIYHEYLKQNNLIEEGAIPKEEYAQFLKVTMLDTIDQTLINADAIHSVEGCLLAFIKEKKGNLEDVRLEEFVEDMSGNLYDFLLQNSDKYDDIIELLYLQKVTKNSQNGDAQLDKKQMNQMTGLEKLTKILQYYWGQFSKEGQDIEARGEIGGQIVKESLIILLEVQKQTYPYPGLYHDCVDEYVTKQLGSKNFSSPQEMMGEIRKSFRKYLIDSPSKCYRFLKILFPHVVKSQKQFYRIFQYREVMYEFVQKYSVNSNKEILREDYPQLLESTLLQVVPIDSNQLALLSLLRRSIAKFIQSKNKDSKMVFFNQIHEDLLSKFSLFLSENVKEYYPILRTFFYEVILQDQQKYKKYEAMMIINQELDQLGPNTYQVQKEQYPNFLKNVLLKSIGKSEKQFGYTKQLLQYLKEFTERKYEDASLVGMKELVADFRYAFVQFLQEGSGKQKEMVRKLYPKMGQQSSEGRQKVQKGKPGPDEEL